MAAFGRPAVWAGQLYHVLAGAVPLGLVAGGGARRRGLAASARRRRRGSISSTVPEFLALGVVLEFAPLGAGLVVAGRSGASLAAELSTMRLTEQLDALETMGAAAAEHLVGPRVLACMAGVAALDRS